MSLFSAYSEVKVLGKALMYVPFCSVQIISRLDSQSKFQMFPIFSGRHVGVPRRYTDQHGGSILGSVNLCRTFRRISDV